MRPDVRVGSRVRNSFRWVYGPFSFSFAGCTRHITAAARHLIRGDRANGLFDRPGAIGPMRLSSGRCRSAASPSSADRISDSRRVVLCCAVVDRARQRDSVHDSLPMRNRPYDSDQVGEPVLCMPSTRARFHEPRVGGANREADEMTKVRCITETGVVVHRGDATRAARRAVSDAIRHSGLGTFGLLGKTAHDMKNDLLNAVPHPSRVDQAAMAAELPYGTVTVRVLQGGLEVPSDGRSDPIPSVRAGVLVHLEVDDADG